MMRELFQSALSAERTKKMSNFTLKSRKRIEKDRAEAEEVRGIAEKIRSDLPFQEFDEVCNNQTILKA